MKHPIVIIGGGYCGIISLKICLENGLDAIVYEKTDNFGGLWRFRENDEYGVASVQRSTIINTSKEMSALSDFIPPAEYPNYMHNSKLLSYLEQYMKHFKLESYIRYKHEVMMVEKNDNYDESGEWKVRIKNQDGEEKESIASAVLVCIGHHVFPHTPTVPGLVDFRGKVLHSHEFKDYKGLEQKRVVVVGVGNSGMDVAVELSNVSTQVYLSTRRGAWIVKRVGPNGVPFDFTINRINGLIAKYFPNYFLDKVENAINQEFDHALYNMKPRHRYNAQHPSLSDALPCRIISGAIVVKGDISRLTATGVRFKGEEDMEYDIDAVVFATGYDMRFPFLGDLVQTQRNKVELYMRLFPPQLKHPTLAIIGLIQPIGPIFPVAEIQLRWVAKLLKGECHLPDLPERLNEIQAFTQKTHSQYVDSQRHTVQVDMIEYMDDIAERIGCKPNLPKIFLTDPKLFWKLLFGPGVAYQYRLTGPHAWSGARDAIMTVQERFVEALSTRYPKEFTGVEQMPNPLIRYVVILSLIFGIGSALFHLLF